MTDTTLRDKLAGELLGALTVASNFPKHTQARLLGQDMRPLAEKCSEAILAAGWRPPARVVTTVEENNGTYVREVVFDGHSAFPRLPSRELEDLGLTVHLWDGSFTGDLGDGRPGWTSATVETGRRMVTVQHGETLRVLVDQTGRATGVVVPVDYGEEQDNGTAISGTD